MLARCLDDQVIGNKLTGRYNCCMISTAWRILRYVFRKEANVSQLDDDARR